jgi:hypothetical protein
MIMVKVWDIVAGILLVAIGWFGLNDGVIHYRGFPAPCPRQFGWLLIALGIALPIAAYILRSRQDKDK